MKYIGNDLKEVSLEERMERSMKSIKSGVVPKELLKAIVWKKREYHYNEGKYARSGSTYFDALCSLIKNL